MSLRKTPAQQADLIIAGQKLQTVFDEIMALIVAGSSTEQIDLAAHAVMDKLQVRPSFLHYQGYPASTCISVNEEVIHGIPSADKILAEGDIVTIDAGLWYKDVCVDAARTFAVGKIDERSKLLLKVTEEALNEGVKQVKPGNRIGAISFAVERVAKRHNLGIVRNYTGHGVGTAVHEEPSIPNYGKKTDGIIMEPGMVLAIEPMLTLGGGEVITLSDGWTVISNDGSRAAQFEHTVLVTNGGHTVLV